MTIIEEHYIKMTERAPFRYNSNGHGAGSVVFSGKLIPVQLIMKGMEFYIDANILNYF